MARRNNNSLVQITRPWLRMAATNANTLKKLVHRQGKLANDLSAAGAEALQTISRADDLKSVFDAQTDYARVAVDHLMEAQATQFETLIEALKDAASSTREEESEEAQAES